MFPDHNIPIDLAADLVDLATYGVDLRTRDNRLDPLVIHTAYAQDKEIYKDGRIIAVDPDMYRHYQQTQPNALVNKFGQAYASGSPLLLHRKLADVLIEVAVDMFDRYGYYTIVMDALRTYDAGCFMQAHRPDLVASGLLAPAGKSAHNRALAVDSKLFEMQDGILTEADEHGHLDDLDMVASNRFFGGPMSDTAKQNRLNRLRAWQRASVKHALPIANLLAEFWDDRVPGSPADLWRVLACRALCLPVEAHPDREPIIADLRHNLDTLHEDASLSRQSFAEAAHDSFVKSWHKLFDTKNCRALDNILCSGAGTPPALADFLFHEWLDTIHDDDLEKAKLPRQSLPLNAKQA